MSKPRAPVPTEWTAADRIMVATRLLGIIQADIPAGRYGEVGRPNVTSVLHVLNESPDVLRAAEAELRLVLEDASATPETSIDRTCYGCWCHERIRREVVHTLPPGHRQAGQRFPTVGEVILGPNLGSSSSAWNRYDVKRLNASNGRPIVDIDGHLVVLRDHEWRWPDASAPPLPVDDVCVAVDRAPSEHPAPHWASYSLRPLPSTYALSTAEIASSRTCLCYRPESDLLEEGNHP